MRNNEKNFMPDYIFTLPPRKVKYGMMTLAEVKNYGHQIHNIPEQWKISKGEGIKIAVLDTGLPIHRDLENQIDGIANFTSSPVEDMINGHSTHVCLTYENEVTIRYNEKIDIISIGCLVENILPFNENVEILSYNIDKEIVEFKKIINYSKKENNKKIRKIKAASYTLRLTEDHKILASKTRKQKPKFTETKNIISNNFRLISPYKYEIDISHKEYTINYTSSLRHMSVPISQNIIGF